MLASAVLVVAAAGATQIGFAGPPAWLNPEASAVEQPTPTPAESAEVREDAPAPSATADATAAAAEPQGEAPTAAPLEEATSVAESSEAVESVLDTQNDIMKRTRNGVAGLEESATGFVLGELQALEAERADQGYKQVGDATIVSSEVISVDLAGTPPTIRFSVCVDSRNFDVVDENGRSLKNLMYTPATPILHLYGAEYMDGAWKVATHEIPTDSTPCA